MVIDNKKMSELLRINKNDIIGDSPLDNWLKELCDKQYSQLNCQDVTTMFNQDIGIEFAAFRAFELLAEEPICGLYDWQIFELIVEKMEIIKDVVTPYFD